MRSGQASGKQSAIAGAITVAALLGAAMIAKAQSPRPRAEFDAAAGRITSSQVAPVGLSATTTATGRAPAAMKQPALTAQAAAANTPPRMASPDVLEINSADRISIKFQGQKDLSGEYRINEDQTVSIPVLGRVPVGHLDAAGLEKSISERLARLTGRDAYVTVEVIEYRPVFVSGYVSKPGTAPWKPGMTVLQAVTVTGGAFRSGGIEGVDTKQQRAIDDQKRVLATIARLTAEQDGAEAMTIPQRLIALVGRKEAQDLIDAQQTSFLSRKNASASLVDGLQRAIAIAKEEFENVKAQRERLSEQLKFRRLQYAKLKALYDKQFLRVDRLSDEEIRIADLEEKVASLSVAASRTDGTLTNLQRDLTNFRQDRRALIDTDLLKLERDAAQLELEIESGGPKPRKLSRPLSDGNTDTAKKEMLVFEIVRQEGAIPRTMIADRNTPVKPGDMVVVSVQ